MAVHQLLAGRVYGTAGGTHFTDGTWNDGSDATFEAVSRTTNSSGSGSTTVCWGWIAPLIETDLPVGFAECTGIRLRMRAKGTATGGGNVVFDTSINYPLTPPGGGTDVAQTDLPFMSASIPCDGVIRDLSFDATAGDLGYYEAGIGTESTDLMDMLRRLTTQMPTAQGLRCIRFAAGSTFGTVQPPSTTRTLTVYEAWLEVVYPDPPLAIAGQQEGTRIRFL